MKNLATHAVTAAPAALANQTAAGDDKSAATAHAPALAYEQQIVQARSLVSQDPKRVAQVVKTWVGEQ